MQPLKVICIVPTYNGAAEIRRLLDSLREQRASFDLCVIDSGSRDGTVEIARAAARFFFQIDNSDFDHGGTRQKALDALPGYDIVVYLTQDSELASADALSRLIEPFSIDEKLGAACGRQLPHRDASPIAAHARYFNYPDESRLATPQDISRWGLKAVFMSNSFAAYRVSALQAIGGFPDGTIFAEDMYVAAKMLLRGWHVRYEANAQCRHSHNYAPSTEFKRYFDAGAFHSHHRWIMKSFGSAGGEGSRFAASEFHYLLGRAPWLIPLSIVRNFMKLIGFRLGLRERSLPIRIKRQISLNAKYWSRSR